MAKKTIEVFECDGANGARCGRSLASIRDGVVLHGTLRAPGAAPGSKPLAGEFVSTGARTPNAGQFAETALCWACFCLETGCPAKLVEDAPERTDR